MQNSYSFNNFNTSSADLFNQQNFYREELTGGRRSSLGNIGHQSSQLNEFCPLTPPPFGANSGILTPSSQFSPIFPSPPQFSPQNYNLGLNDGIQEKNTSNLFQFIQLQQQVRQMNENERLANFLNQSTFPELDHSNRSNPNLRFQTNNNNEPRRNSVCLSTLRPVRESRTSSPTNLMLTNRELIQQKIDQARDYNNNLPLTSNARYQMPRKFSIDSNLNPGGGGNFKAQRNHRAQSMGGGSTGSFDSGGSFSRLMLDGNEEKLAKTGSIFQRREDWSIIGKLPINKQNTIHIRLEDEGPYGNDETRCFVLSHFSSLGVKELSCIFCSCELVIYDRFPLIDGTLFISPFLYDEKKGIPALISNQNQYIYAICLNCMSGKNKQNTNINKIECKSCHKQWSTGNSLQIGTLYKYDIFAAEPCCKMRVACKKCRKSLVDLKTSGGLPYFSMYSEKKECANCKTKDYHFIKPLEDIYVMPPKKSQDKKEKEEKTAHN